MSKRESIANDIVSTLSSYYYGYTSSNFNLFGNSKVFDTQYKFGKSSIFLDGNGDYLKTKNLVNFIASNFTIEFWIRPRSVSQQAFLVDQRDASVLNGLAIRQDGTAINVYRGSTTLFSVSSVFPTADTWYHVAVSKSGSVTKLFINGVEKGLSTVTMYSASNYMNVGKSVFDSQYYDGFIDEFRLSNSARYTDDFTVATTAFDSDGSTLILEHFDGAFEFKKVTREPFDFEKLSNAQFPAVLVQSSTESREDVTIGGSDITREGTIDYVLVGYVKDSSIDTARNQLLEVIENALDVDRTRGGNALDTQIVSVETDEGSIDPIGGVLVTVRVLYNFTRGAV